MNPTPIHTPEPKPDNPLTVKNKCRKRKRNTENSDTIKVGCIVIEKRDVTFEF